MANLTDLPYARWLEDALQKLVTEPVESICIMYRKSNGDVHIADFDNSTADKILFAGYLQQDAMLDGLRVRGIIPDEDEDEDEDDTEDNDE